MTAMELETAAAELEAVVVGIKDESEGVLRALVPEVTVATPAVIGDAGGNGMGDGGGG